ncbi:MAG: aldo/keto reductase [Porticoccaceae bacterium]
MKRLHTDIIDMVLVHSDGNDEVIINQYGTLDALAALKAEGKIRAFGMSTKTVSGGLLAAEKSDGVMVTWNLQYADELPVIDYCRDHGKGVLIKKALASGHAALGEEDPVQKTFEMLFAHSGVSSAIVGSINPSHLSSNVAKAVRATAGL